MTAIRAHRFPVALLVSLCIFASCGGARGNDPDQVKVAIAANLAYVIDILKSDFATLHPDITLQTLLSSSGRHTTLILNGAAYDLFISADMHYPEKLWKEGFALESPVPYACGTLVIFTAGDLDLSRGIYVCNDPAVKHIAVGNPVLTVYGRATEEAVEKAGITAIKNKFITAQNIMLATNYAMNAADMGLIPRSALSSPMMKRYNHKGKNWIEVDRKLYAPIEQGMVLLRGGNNPGKARLFFDYLLSDRARKIFQSAGYYFPPGNKRDLL